VASDDLNAPLGKDKRKRLPKLPAAGPQMLAGILGLFGLVVVSWALFVNDPLGGEPVAVVAARQPGTDLTKQDDDGDGKQHARHDGLTAAAQDPAAVAAAAAAAKVPPPGSKTITIIDGSSGKSQDVIIPGNSAGASSKTPVDPKLLETTRHGAIPQIAPDGTRPSAQYARPLQLPPNKKDFPRIAIVIGGLGTLRYRSRQTGGTRPRRES
jgi:uncharacterized protein